MNEIFNNPKKDYTKKLISSVPKLGAMIGKKFPEPLKLDSKNKVKSIIDHKIVMIARQLEGLPVDFSN